MTLDLDSLTAVSPVDGRYARHTAGLRRTVSEYGLIRTRCLVEFRWFQHLASVAAISDLPSLTDEQSEAIELAINSFSVEDAEQVKTLEATTNHDVKAVEYFVKEKITRIEGLENSSEFVHFACTSEDINNLSYALMLKSARDDVMSPLMQTLISALSEQARKYAAVPKIGRAHV